MAKKRATSKSAKAASPSRKGPTQRTKSAGPVLRTEPCSRFTLYDLLGHEHAWYRVDRFELTRPDEQAAEKAVAHSILLIDRSGSMTPAMEDLKETLVKLLTLEEYRQADLLVTLISYSGQGDLQVHFQREPIAEVMKRGSKALEEIRKIHPTGPSCVSQALQLAGSLVQDSELTAITLHSDGYANDPSALSEAQMIEGVIAEMQDRPLFVNTIAYSDGADFRLLAKIANAASGACVRAGGIKEVYDALYRTSRLLGGETAPPVDEPLSADYDYQVLVSHSAGRVNGAAGPLHVRGLGPKDDALVYKYRRLTKPQHAALEAPEVQTGEAVLAFARAQLAEGNLNTAKYAVASSFDRTLFDRHARALTNGEVAALADDLDLLLFQPGLIAEQELVREALINRKIPLLSLMWLLDEHREGFEINLDHLEQSYRRTGLRRVHGTRDAAGKLVPPWLKADLVERGAFVRVAAVEISRRAANLNLLIARRVRLVRVADGTTVEQVAGVPLNHLSLFNAYSVVSDGELNVLALRLKITDAKLYERLALEGVLEVEGAPPASHDPETEYTLRLDNLPLVPPFEGPVNLDGVFEQLAEMKVLASICAAHLRDESDRYRPEQVEELKRHYLSKNLYLNFPTTTEYADRDKALAEGSIDTRTSYRIDLGSRTILNLDRLPPANKFLERAYEVRDVNGQKIDRATFEDTLEDATIRAKPPSPKARPTRTDDFMRRLFDDFLGLHPNGSAVAVLRRVGANDLAKIVEERARGRQPARAAFVAALTQARRALERASDELFAERVSPLVFYIGATGALPDEMPAKALTAEQLMEKYPDLVPSREEQEGLFFEVGQAILTVHAVTEHYSR
jgi:Mg-chelatase subunit ChlD